MLNRQTESVDDRFRIIEELGQGGQGRVYLVADEADGGRLLALKLLHEANTDALLAEFKNAANS